MDSTDNKWIIRKFYKHCYKHCCYPSELTTKVKFLRRHKLLKLTPKETDNLNKPVSIKEMEFVVKNLPMKKYSG